MKEQVDLMMRIVAVAAYIFVGVFPYAVSSLVVPPIGVGILWGLWLAGWWVVVRAVRRSPKWAWSISILALGIWVVFVAAGGALFGWSA